MTKLFFSICFILIQFLSSFVYAQKCEDLFKSKEHGEFSTLSVEMISLGPQHRLGEVQGADTPVRTQCGGTCYLEAVVETVDRELRASGDVQYRLNRPELFARWLIQRVSNLDFNAPNLHAKIIELMRSGSVIQFIDFLSGNLKLTVRVETAQAMQREDEFIQGFTKEIIGLAKAHAKQDNQSGGLILLPSSQSSHYDYRSALRRYIDWLKVEVMKVSPTLSGLEKNINFSKIDLPQAISGKTVFNSQLEAEIKNRLHHGRGVMVRFNMLSSLHAIHDGRAGFYEVTKDKLHAESASLRSLVKDENLHFGAVIDYLNGPDGNIEYLVIKNSWGTDDTATDNGYIYLNVGYLSLFGREIYFSEIPR